MLGHPLGEIIPQTTLTNVEVGKFFEVGCCVAVCSRSGELLFKPRPSVVAVAQVGVGVHYYNVEE